MKALVAREWLFFLSLMLFVSTSLFIGSLPHYSQDEYQILFILFTLFVVIEGLKRTRFLHALAINMERLGLGAYALIVGTFLISFFVTNDVALIIMVPLTLSMQITNRSWAVILEAIAANAAALLPYSTPQNLYIYWHYHIPALQFMLTIAPFVFFFFLLTLLGVWWFDIRIQKSEIIPPAIHKKAYPYLFFFLLILGVIFNLLPLWLGGLVIFYALLLDTRSLRIDYFLLATFYLFFGIADNFTHIFASQLHHPHHIFLLSIFLSQLMSNVPATLLLANFTHEWQSLLWGVSVGGYGVLWGSLANLIAYRFYAKEFGNQERFLQRFLLLNILALLLGIALFFSCYKFIIL
ncbi:SLC13 family permease [Nitratiruptor tergarcus]|uniref:Na+/H+ antiporter NhaD n=1 Tax=Nitratiruptor tergarcus DSM 16512 TaxID=1069081 RepID=A0A1W1WU57_9BACT|nr:SLC13 family permease [Nitratiruptor tergarcus]SMC09719.1 Na+/H+ antiporter NhaD [Nitratiruptor tergarcus DSM 16512]